MKFLVLAFVFKFSNAATTVNRVDVAFVLLVIKTRIAYVEILSNLSATFSAKLVHDCKAIIHS